VLVETLADQRQAGGRGVDFRRGLLDDEITHASLKW
jgi:hypothetical protein